MKIRLALVAAMVMAFAAVSRGQTSWTISSPDSSVQATVQLANLNGTADYANSKRLYYSVSLTKPTAAEVVPPSPMGLVRSDGNFVDGLSFVSETPQIQVDSTYTMVAGKRKVCRDFCNQKTLTFASANGGSKLEIVLRAYNEGFAFRYRFPETDTTARTVTREETGIRMPDKSIAWMMAYDVYTNGKYQPAYENYWNNAIPVGTLAASVPTASSPPSGWAMPALFKTPSGQYALFFETDVTDSYCGSHLSEPTQNVYRIAQPLDAEGAGRDSVNPSYPLPWTMPWRVVVVGATLAPILENTLAFDLASPSTIADVSWIKPGRSSWSWWSDNNTRNYSTHIAFVDLAQQMTWEYCLLDGGWDGITGDGTWQSVVKYATDRNVGISVWYTSGANGNPSKMMDPATRKKEFDMLSAAGVKGVKIDFFHSDKQWTMKFYQDILKDAAADHLVVNFHGCTIGRGWQRTYPNLLSMEAVRGAEYYKSHATYPADQPARNTILPFTRNSLMSMDYTPVTFTNNRRPHLTTYGHELALSIVFESGIQHLADRVSGYSTATISQGARTFLQQVPVAWDDTRYLLGTPGTYVVLARQKGNDWYIGGISGEAAGRSVIVPLSFLAPGTSYHMTRIADGASDTTFDEQTGSVASTDSITVAMRARGGFVARLTAAPAKNIRRIVSADVSKIRGFNYQSAPTLGHNEHWLQYDPAETERDMDYAQRLNLNQVRVFLGYTAYLRDKAAFRTNLVHFVRACHQRGIGVMPTVQYPRAWSQDQASWPLAKEYAADLVNTIGNGKEPGLAFWDVHNEPGNARIEFARHMAGVFRELDKVTPITIGSTTESEMEATGSDLVDVLCFHDYSSTRREIRANIERAKKYAAKAGKQVMNTEIGCIGRSNPYDVTLEEYMKSGVGWYIWELMITRQWGTVHGVLYADGTVRDPSIAAALLGFFRNRGPEVMSEVADREGQVTRAVAEGKKWLADPNAAWEPGLDLAERSANLLEAAQLIAMHDPPTRQVDLLRRGQPDMPALRALVEKFTGILEAYQVPAGDPQRSRPTGWIR